MSQPSIVFVHLGEALPVYLADALAQARDFNRCPILLIGNAAALRAQPPDPALDIVRVPVEQLPVDPVWQAFKDTPFPADETFRFGYWRLTSERFFALASLMRLGGMTDVLHLETDVMLYRDLTDLAPAVAGAGLAAPFGSAEHAIAGILHVRDAAAIEGFCRFMVDCLKTPPPWRYFSDMFALGAYRAAFGPAALKALPTLPADYDGSFDSPEGLAAGPHDLYLAGAGETDLFDGLGIGYRLLGPDPRAFDGAPRRDPLTVYDLGSYALDFAADDRGRRLPFLARQGRRWRVNNLHVHAKTLNLYRSRPQPRAAATVAAPVAAPSGSDAITPEGLAAAADAVIVSRRALDDRGPPFGVAPDRLIVLDGSPDQFVLRGQGDIVACDRGGVIAVAHDHLVAFLRDVFAAHLTQPFTLVVPASDYRFTDQLLPLLNDPRLRHWFASNVEVHHPKLTALPHGLPPGYPPDLPLTAEAVPRDGLLAPVAGESDPARRFALLRRHRFCAAPPDPCADTHLVWEALYAGCVPVVAAGAAHATFAGLGLLHHPDPATATAAWLDRAAAALPANDPDRALLSLDQWRRRIRACA